MKILKTVFRALPFVAVAAVFLALILFPRAQASAQPARRVVQVWNVDTFEGGKGSRTAFLNRVARRVEKKRPDVFYFVTDYTLQGAEAALAEGDLPDVLSFGVGLDSIAEHALPLERSFAGGRTDGGCLAYPWCRGSYYLFSADERFDAEGRTAISCGGKNLPSVAAAYAGIEGEELDSEAAYLGFLGGEYRYLLGTQRDVCRFEARGMNVSKRKLTAYCDLFQYVSVLSAEERADGFAFLEELFSEETRSRLGEIGMEEAVGDGCRTPSVFSSAVSLGELAAAARQGRETNFLDKFLKTV